MTTRHSQNNKKTKRVLKQQNSKKNGRLFKNLIKKLKTKGLPILPASHHDQFFKRFFSQIFYAKELLKLILSPKELAQCDLKSLKVEKALSQTKRMDLILSFYFKHLPNKQIKILILVEHKSKFDKKLYSQVLSYQAELYKEADEEILVIPVLFYHGRVSWRWKTSFQEGVLGGFFSKIPSSLKKSMINCDLRVIDTNTIEDKSLRAVFRAKSSKMACVLKSLDKIWLLRDNKHELEKLLFSIFRGFKTKKELLVFTKYFRLAGVSYQDLRGLEKKAKTKGLITTKGGFMDIREEIMLDGWQKGLKQGEQKKRNEVILNMLKNKLDISMISKVTGLSVKEIKKFKNGS